MVGAGQMAGDPRMVTYWPPWNLDSPTWWFVLSAVLVGAIPVAVLIVVTAR
jgi:hypothetical protein